MALLITGAAGCTLHSSIRQKDAGLDPAADTSTETHTDAGTEGPLAGDATSDTAPELAACVPVPSPGDDLLSDFETGLATVLPATGRGGTWYTTNDSSKRGTQYPPAGTVPPPATSVAGGAPCSRMAFRTYGSGFTSWGAGIGTYFGAGGDGSTRVTYDASQYSGLRFWARVGAGSTTIIRFLVDDANTNPFGGRCDPAVTAGTTACYDDWGIALTLTETWAQYTVSFGALQQEGWGMQFPALLRDRIYAIELRAAPDSAFDLWIDDIAFVR